MRIHASIAGLVVIMTLIACCSGGSSDKSSAGKPDKLTIAAAASTQFAVREIAETFSAQHNIKVDVIIGSSGKLTTQILNGAPYDILFSANMKYPEALFDKKKGVGKPLVFGFGVPTFWTMDTTIKLDMEGKFLLSDNIEKIVIAEPKNAPYGEMAINFFKKNELYDKIESHLVYGESISQVNEYITNKTAQVGVSAKSIILSPKIENKGNYLPLDREYWVPQGLIELENEGPSDVKSKLMEYIMSEEGSRILKKYGYEK